MKIKLKNVSGTIPFNSLFDKVKNQIRENSKSKVKGFYEESLTMRPYSKEHMDFLFY